MDAMDEKIEMLLYGQYYKKLQKAVYAPLLQQYQITLLDLRVMLFLDGNKQRNTARDIVEIHYFTKSDVSKSIESLMEKGYLAKKQDSHDRRCIHLEILPTAEPVLAAAHCKKKKMLQILFQGITEQEVEVIGGIANKMAGNIVKALEEKEVSF